MLYWRLASNPKEDQVGNMQKKRTARVHQLEDELVRLEAINGPRLKVQHRIARLKGKDLPKAKRNAK